jgi:hypothetical protein
MMLLLVGRLKQKGIQRDTNNQRKAGWTLKCEVVPDEPKILATTSSATSNAAVAAAIGIELS